MMLNKRKSLQLLGSSLILGITTDVLVRQEIFGLNFLLWTLLWTSILGFGLYKCKKLNVKTLLYVLFASTNAVMVYVRSEPVVQAWSVLSTLSFLGLLFAALYLNNFFELSYVRRATEYFGGAIVSLLKTLVAIARSFRSPKDTSPKRNLATPGVVVGTLLVVLFIALFSSADQVFSRNFTWLGDALEPIGDWLNNFNIGRVVSILFFAGAALVWLSMIISRHTVEDTSEARLPKIFSIKDKQVILGSVCVIFALFVGVQLRFLFGGASLPEGITYADYARSGYGQLLLATALASGVVYVTKNATKASLARERNWLSVLLLGLNAMVVVSAWKRLSLYESAYGWTMTRFVARMGLLCLMAGIVYLLIWSVGKLSTRHLFAASWYTLTVVLLGAALLNPAGLITKRNIVDISSRETALDVYYLTGQSLDSFMSICKYAPTLFDKHPNEYEKLASYYYFEQPTNLPSGPELRMDKHFQHKNSGLSAHYTKSQSFFNKTSRCL